VSTTVAIAQIFSRTVIELALIGAAVRLAPAVLPRLTISNPRGQGRNATGPAAAGAAGEPDERRTTRA
jgi:hypothetical protein